MTPVDMAIKALQTFLFRENYTAHTLSFSLLLPVAVLSYTTAKEPPFGRLRKVQHT